ncbi:ATP-binding protein [Kitasatospora sp. NPDC050543]|uniref:ATP-binding protein n=1 Tax=Kitasatospora sp. NPDC050543 TaxID=3364054 RepID=UPI003798A44C
MTATTEEPAALPATWEERNNAYLGAALHWLRLRLQALAEEDLHRPAAQAGGGAHGAGGQPGRSVPHGSGGPMAGAPVPHGPVLGPAPTAGPPRARRWRLFRRPARAATAPQVALGPPEGPPSAPLSAQPSVPPAGAPEPADALALAAAARDAAAAAVHSAHDELSDRLGLTDFERDVLLLAAAREFDPAVDALCAAAGAGGPQPGPTFGLALRLFDRPAWDALSPERPLRRLRLVELEGGAGLTGCVLRADERVTNYLKGLDHLDERLAESVVSPDDGDGVGLSPSQREAARALSARLRRAAAGGRPTVVNLVGPDQVSKQLTAAQVAAETGRALVRVPVSALPAQAGAAGLTARLWERETLLAPLALYLDAGDDAGEHGPETAAVLGRLLARLRGPVFLDSREVWPHLGPGALVVDVAGPTTGEQRAAWTAALGAGREQLAGELAAQFDLDPVALGLAALAALTTADEDGADQPGGAPGVPDGGTDGGADQPGGAPGVPDGGTDGGAGDGLRSRLWGACLAATRPRLDLLARRLEVRARREDLVLPAEITEQLDRIGDQLRLRALVHEDWGVARQTSRGLGITALFAGESGTGKTTTAEVLAHELSLDLYRIDLSAVVSKYIGETEKNLRRLFDAAERGGAILFFDEADALFGRRSEVRDSHDRYANIEISYLLQRMESYRGLAILATNMKGALDQAFTRRLRFVLDFPFPGPAEREAIWRRAFAPGVTTHLDHARLARFGLTGGSIHNIAMNATFAAAGSAGRVAGMPQVLPALRMECRKLGLVLDEGEFRWEEAQAPALAEPGAEGSRPWT